MAGRNCVRRKQENKWFLINWSLSVLIRVMFWPWWSLIFVKLFMVMGIKCFREESQQRSVANEFSLLFISLVNLVLSFVSVTFRLSVTSSLSLLVGSWISIDIEKPRDWERSFGGYNETRFCLWATLTRIFSRSLSLFHSPSFDDPFKHSEPFSPSRAYGNISSSWVSLILFPELSPPFPSSSSFSFGSFSPSFSRFVRAISCIPLPRATQASSHLQLPCNSVIPIWN